MISHISIPVKTQRSLSDKTHLVVPRISFKNDEWYSSFFDPKFWDSCPKRISKRDGKFYKVQKKKKKKKTPFISKINLTGNAKYDLTIQFIYSYKSSYLSFNWPTMTYFYLINEYVNVTKKNIFVRMYCFSVHIWNCKVLKDGLLVGNKIFLHYCYEDDDV